MRGKYLTCYVISLAPSSPVLEVSQGFCVSPILPLLFLTNDLETNIYQEFLSTSFYLSFLPPLQVFWGFILGVIFGRCEPLLEDLRSDF